MAAVLEDHLADHGAARDVRDVLRRKCQQGIHDEAMRSSDTDDAKVHVSYPDPSRTTRGGRVEGRLRGNFARPKGEAIGVPGTQLMANRGDVVDQSQLFEAVVLWSWRGVDVQVGEGEQARLSPLIDGRLDLGVPHQVRRAIGPRLLDRNVIIGASDLVLGTVLALRKTLVTANVTLLASLATFAGLGVARNT